MAGFQTFLSGRLSTFGDIIRLEFSTSLALLLFLGFFLLRVLLRRPWLAAAVFIVFNTAGRALSEGASLMTARLYAIQLGLAIFILTRFGLFPMIVVVFVSNSLMDFPLTTDFSTWYAGSTIFALAVVLLLTAYAFHTAVAGRALFKDSFLETG